jgi:hypothetical protein
VNVIKADIDEKGMWEECTHDDIEKVSAKTDEKRVEIIVTLSAVIEIPKRWIYKDSFGNIKLKNGDDGFFIGLRKEDVCLTRESDFGLTDYLHTDEFKIQIVEGDCYS